MGFKGRLAFKQFIRTKRARFGVKLYQICTATDIPLDYMIYHGGMSAELDDNPGFGMAENIALTLVKTTPVCW